MGRNKIVYALSMVTVVVSCDEGKGGTWQGATEAMSRSFGHVATWMGDGAGSGNRALVKLGAVPIHSLEDPSWMNAEPSSLAAAKPKQLSFGA
jgi:predicted Rossmann fold nucleotide-binding protein DprA/Smf involved in DNA uptake